MAGGAIVSTSNKQYGGKMTSFVLLACIMASSGGLIFGYDIGISGKPFDDDDELMMVPPPSPLCNCDQAV